MSAGECAAPYFIRRLVTNLNHSSMIVWFRIKWLVLAALITKHFDDAHFMICLWCDSAYILRHVLSTIFRACYAFTNSG